MAYRNKSKLVNGHGAKEELTTLRQELEQTRRLLADQERLIHIGSWERDLETHEFHWSDEIYRIYGLDPETSSPDAYLGATITVPEDRAKRSAWLEAVEAAGGGELEETLRIRRPDGEIRTLKARAAVMADPGTGRRRIAGTVWDITDQARVHHSEILLSQVVQSALEAIITIDHARLVTSWNPAAERLFGYTSEEMIGHTMTRLRPGDLTETELLDIEERDRQLLVGEVETVVYETRRQHKNSSVIHVDARWSALRDSDGVIVGAVVSVRDVSEAKRDETRIAHMANHDPLTGLLNRHGFETALEQAVASNESGALLMLDLDNFKYVNETHGHKLGDALVVELAGALRRCLGEHDLLARLGGDEFCVITSPATLDQAKALADTLLLAVRGHTLDVDGTAAHCTASIGVAGFEGSSGRPSELMADVDRAMYASKEAGRDRVTLYTQADRTMARQSARSAGEHMIRDALANDRFELYTQPIVNLTSGLMTHCEVLLRLRGADDEIILPGAFLPTAERLGLIHLIDYWVIDRALAVAAQHPDLTFEINLSGATIDDEHLEGYIARHLTQHGADPARIVFELTETAAVGAMTRARDLAAALGELGCSFAIDDFGAGFSTFYYLKHFPARYVKIDGEFMKDPHSRLDELVIESIVRIGRDLGKLTIAEYVSDYAAMERVRALGVDYGQGYYFAKPFPVSQLASCPRKLLLDDVTLPAQPLYAHSA
jgi:diguanylate cyclase (GGDEF)-like protein/PAS domain S-box-containing protein